MSTLTQNERDGLDDVFLSIHVREDKLEKLREILNFIISLKKYFSVQKLSKQVKYGLNETNRTTFINYLYKKKKNLSK